MWTPRIIPDPRLTHPDYIPGYLVGPDGRLVWGCAVAGASGHTGGAFGSSDSNLIDRTAILRRATANLDAAQEAKRVLEESTQEQRPECPVTSGVSSTPQTRTTAYANTPVPPEFVPGFLRRFAAEVLDNMLVWFIVLHVTNIGEATMDMLDSLEEQDDSTLIRMVLEKQIHLFTEAEDAWTGLMFFYCIMLIHQMLGVLAFGGTFGKLLLGIRIVRRQRDAEGQLQWPTLGRNFLRAVLKMLTSYLAAPLFLVVLFNNEGRAFHDRLADTQSVLASQIARRPQR